MMNSSVKLEERLNDSSEEIHKATLVSNGAIINFVKLATSTLVSLPNTDNVRRCVLASKCLIIVQNVFKFAGHMFFPCDATTNNMRSGFINGGAVTTLHKCVERNDDTKLNNDISDV